MTFKLTESSSWLTTDIIYAGGACSGFGVKDFGGGSYAKIPLVFVILLQAHHEFLSQMTEKG